MAKADKRCNLMGNLDKLPRRATYRVPQLHMSICKTNVLRTCPSENLNLTDFPKMLVARLKPRGSKSWARPKTQFYVIADSVSPDSWNEDAPQTTKQHS